MSTNFLTTSFLSKLPFDLLELVGARHLDEVLQDVAQPHRGCGGDWSKEPERPVEDEGRQERVIRRLTTYPVIIHYETSNGEQSLKGYKDIDSAQKDNSEPSETWPISTVLVNGKPCRFDYQFVIGNPWEEKKVGA